MDIDHIAKKWFTDNEEHYNLYDDPDEMVVDAFKAGFNSNSGDISEVRTASKDGIYYILESNHGVTPISKRAYDLINQQNTVINKLRENEQDFISNFTHKFGEKF